MCTFYKCAVLFLIVHSGLAGQVPRDSLAGAVYQDLVEQAVGPHDVQCRETTLAMLLGVQNFTLWATWMWESSAVSPVGSLSGSQQQLGNWQQCAQAPAAMYCLVRVRVPGGRGGTPGGHRGDVDPYASAEEYLHTPTKYGRQLDKMDFGVCLPPTCSHSFVQQFLGSLLAHGIYGAVEHQPELVVDSCEVAGEGRELTPDSYVFIVLAIALIALVALCTVYTEHTNIGSQPAPVLLQLARCFSLRDNYQLLFEKHPDEIPEMNGIRFVSSAGVVMLHNLMLRRSYSNGVEVEQMIDNLLMKWLLQMDLLVDTFFTMSGFLLVRSALARPASHGSLWRQPLRRYIRLAPVMIAAMFCLSSVYIHTGSGPLWTREVGRMVDACRETWWLGVLMLGNYVRTEQMCYLASWSVQCEFHFFIIGCCIMSMYRRSRACGLAAYAVAAAASLAVPAAVTDINRFPAVLLPFGFERVKDLFHDDYFLKRYIPTHYRLSPYLVGMAAGYLVPRAPARGKIKQRYSALAAGACGLTVLALLYSGAFLYSVAVPRAAAALYAALNRTVWALAVCGLIATCVLGTVPLVSEFLSWRVFRPLSRLAYGIYLTHCGLFLYIYMSAQDPSRVGLLETLVTYLGALSLSVGLAGALWLLLEAPATHLAALLLRTRRKPPPANEEPNTGTVIYSNSKQ